MFKFNIFTYLYPWKIITFLLNIKLSCELNLLSSQINFDEFKYELNKILDGENFVSHNGDHSGGWGSICLVSYGGDPYNDLVNDKEVLPTRLLKNCPEIKKFLDMIPGKKFRVRFMEIQANSQIFWHYDNNETIDCGSNNNARIHIPIITNPEIDLQICHENNYWKCGKIYYGDFSFPHSINNKSNKNRIHLVIDVLVNDKLLKLFPKEFLKEKKKRILVRKICQRILNFYKKLNLVKKG